MSFELTLIVLAIAGAAFALASWRSMRPVDPLKPRMVPWRAVIIVSGAVGLFMLAPLMTKLGLTEDRPSS